jgi:hypothetical protein
MGEDCKRADGRVPADGPERDSLVLRVDGQDVTLNISEAAYEVGNDDEAGGLYFVLAGEKFEIRGLFDTNGDGEIDEDDVFEYDANGDVLPASMVNKPSPVETTEDTDTFVELPGLGRCSILEGSSFTVTEYTPREGPAHGWSGTVTLRLRTRKGPKTVEGVFRSSSVSPE